MNSPVLDRMTWSVRGPLHAGRYHATRPALNCLARAQASAASSPPAGKAFTSPASRPGRPGLALLTAPQVRRSQIHVFPYRARPVPLDFEFELE